MPRTIAALFDSRAEADLARARLVSEVKAKSPRIIGKDTAAAVDGLKIAPADAETYREELRRGGHLLVAEVPTGASAKRIIELLEQSAGKASDEPEERTWGDGEQGVQVALPDDTPSAKEAEPAPDAPPRQEREEQAEPAPQPQAEPIPASAAPEQAAAPAVKEELRVGKREVARGGARVRSFTRETPAEEQVSLREEVVEVDSRPSERRLTDSEVEAGGLFKERVFEIAEMREEPVVTKEAVVREEVIVRKIVKERTETIRDTVRHTEIEVEDLGASDRHPGR